MTERDEDLATLSDTRQSLPIMLLRTREAVMARFRPMLRDIDVTEQQWRVLRVLEEQEELDVTTISRRAAILGPSLTRILKSLKEKNYLAMRRDEADGRRSLAKLTAEGRALVHSAAGSSAAIYSEIMEQVGADEISALVHKLDQVLLALGDAPPDGEPSGRD